MTQYSIELRARKYVKGCRFLSFARNWSNEDNKQLLDTGINAQIIDSQKKVVHKAAEATGEFLENDIAHTVGKSNDDKNVKTKDAIDENSINFEEIIIPININQTETSVIKIKQYKIYKYLNDSTV